MKFLCSTPWQILEPQHLDSTILSLKSTTTALNLHQPHTHPQPILHHQKPHSSQFTHISSKENQHPAHHAHNPQNMPRLLRRLPLHPHVVFRLDPHPPPLSPLTPPISPSTSSKPRPRNRKTQRRRGRASRFQRNAAIRGANRADEIGPRADFGPP